MPLLGCSEANPSQLTVFSVPFMGRPLFHSFPFLRHVIARICSTFF